jgi:hypothetical protein
VVKLVCSFLRHCPCCGTPRWAAYHHYRTVTTLSGVLRLPLKMRRCIPPAGPQFQRPYRPEEEGRDPIGAYLPLFPSPNATFMPPFAVGQDLYGLAVPARLAQWIPDALDAVDDCIENGVNGGDTPGDAPPTTSPAPAAAASLTPTRSPTNCSPPPVRVRLRRSTGDAAMLLCFHATTYRKYKRPFPPRHRELPPSLASASAAHCGTCLPAWYPQRSHWPLPPIWQH